jgi:hypothetical protein
LKQNEDIEDISNTIPAKFGSSSFRKRFMFIFSINQKIQCTTVMFFINSYSHYSLRKFQDVLDLDILLKGSPILTVEENTEIFDAVHHFITGSRRFT